MAAAARRERASAGEREAGNRERALSSVQRVKLSRSVLGSWLWRSTIARRSTSRFTCQRRWSTGADAWWELSTPGIRTENTWRKREERHGREEAAPAVKLCETRCSESCRRSG